MKKRDEWDEKDFISLERKYRVLIMIVTLCPRIVQLIWSCIKCVIIAWEEEESIASSWWEKEQLGAE